MKLFEISLDESGFVWDWIGSDDISDEKIKAYWEHLSLNPAGLEIKDLIIEKLHERLERLGE